MDIHITIPLWFLQQTSLPFNYLHVQNPSFDFDLDLWHYTYFWPVVRCPTQTGPCWSPSSHTSWLWLILNSNRNLMDQRGKAAQWFKSRHYHIHQKNLTVTVIIYPQNNSQLCSLTRKLIIFMNCFILYFS